MRTKGILKAGLTSLLLVTVMLAGCLDPGDGGGGGQGGDGDQGNGNQNGNQNGGNQPDVEALKIGTLLPLTGDLSPYGPSAENSVRLAVQHVNAAGGVNGKDVQIQTADSETNEEAASSAASQLIDVEGVHAIVGAMGSGITLSFIDYAVGNEIPVISPSNTAPTFTEMGEQGETQGWYFRTVPSDALQGAVMADVVQEAGHQSAAILAINNDYGVGFADVFQQRYEAAGGQVTQYVRYDPQGTDFSSDVETAASGNPDAVVLIGYPDTGEIIVRNAFERNFIGPGTDMGWYFSEGLMDPEFIRGQQTQDGQYILEGYTGTNPQPAEDTNQLFRADFEEEYGQAPALFSDRTYDAAMVLMLASEYCDCVSGQEFQDAIRDVQNAPGEEVVYDAARAIELTSQGQDIVWTGAAGPMEFDENGDIAAPYQVWTVENGEISVTQQDIWPNE